MTWCRTLFHSRIQKISSFLVEDRKYPNIGDRRPALSADEAVSDVLERRDRPEPQHQDRRIDIDVAAALIGHMDPGPRLVKFAKGVIAHANGFRTNERPRQPANAMADQQRMEI